MFNYYTEKEGKSANKAGRQAMYITLGRIHTTTAAVEK
jgi:hypothetical protein